MLPITTGVGATVVGGYRLDIAQLGLLLLAVGIVAVAATFIRVGFRRGKRVDDR